MTQPNETTPIHEALAALGEKVSDLPSCVRTFGDLAVEVQRGNVKVSARLRKAMGAAEPAPERAPEPAE